MAKVHWITDKTCKRLIELKSGCGIENLEALGNMLLILALSDKALIERAISFIKSWDLDKGAERLERENPSPMQKGL